MATAQRVYAPSSSGRVGNPVWRNLPSIPIATGILASRKGYSFFIWVFAAGCIGLVTLAFLPFVELAGESKEEQEAARKRGNTIGAVLAGISVVLLILRFALGG